MDTRHAPRRTSLLDVTPQASGALLSSRSSPRLAFRWSGSSCGARLPLLCFFGRGPTAVSSSLPDPVDSAFGDPAPDSPGKRRRHWVVSPPLPGGSDRLSLVDESRSHPRSLYRPRLASPLRRLLLELGEAWPSLS